MDKLDPQQTLAVLQCLSFAGHPDVNSVTVFRGQPVLAIVHPILDQKLCPEGVFFCAGHDAIADVLPGGRDERVPCGLLLRAGVSCNNGVKGAMGRVFFGWENPVQGCMGREGGNPNQRGQKTGEGYPYSFQ